MKKNKVDIIILGGSGLLGKSIIKKFIVKKNRILNLDINNIKKKSKYYFFESFDMTSKDLDINLKKIFKFYSVPKIYIDCSYINRDLLIDIDFNKITKTKLNRVLNDWLSSSIIISSYILTKMKKSKIESSVILTSSIYGVVAQDPNVYKNTNIKENIGYTLVKSGINNFVKNAATIYGPYNIRVNSISPGGIKNKHDKNFNNKIFKKNYLKKVPLKRFANADEIANIYEFIGSNNSSYITGFNLIADGGFTLT